MYKNKLQNSTKQISFVFENIEYNKFFYQFSLNI